MSVIIRCVGSAKPGRPCPSAGLWLKRYDPEFAGGRGQAEWTSDPFKAKTFESYADALSLVHAVPRCRPERPDGKPNMPLTAYHIATEPAP